MFCGDNIAVVGLVAAAEGEAAFETAVIPYCTLKRMKLNGVSGGPSVKAPWTLGINITVSVGQNDRQVVVSRWADWVLEGGR